MAQLTALESLHYISLWPDIYGLDSTSAFHLLGGSLPPEQTVNYRGSPNSTISYAVLEPTDNLSTDHPKSHFQRHNLQSSLPSLYPPLTNLPLTSPTFANLLTHV